MKALLPYLLFAVGALGLVAMPWLYAILGDQKYAVACIVTGAVSCLTAVLGLSVILNSGDEQ